MAIATLAILEAAFVRWPIFDSFAEPVTDALFFPLKPTSLWSRYAIRFELPFGGCWIVGQPVAIF
jgi:hypothetical protein